MKKLLSIVLLLSAISFAGCGKGANENPSGGDVPSQEEENDPRVFMSEDEVLDYASKHYSNETKKYLLSVNFEYKTHTGYFLTAAKTSKLSKVDEYKPFDKNTIIKDGQSKIEYYLLDNKIHVAYEYTGLNAKNNMGITDDLEVGNGNEFKVSTELEFDENGYYLKAHSHCYALVSSSKTEPVYHGELEYDAYGTYTEAKTNSK